jgi:hypothetical protein
MQSYVCAPVCEILSEFFPNELCGLMRSYIALKPNQSLMYQDMEDVLLVDGVVESNSPKNRGKLYSYLQKNKIKYKADIIGYTDGGKMLARYINSRGEKWAMKWSVGRIMKWINQERIFPSDVSKACLEPFIFEDIKIIFDKTIPYQKRYNILVERWGNYLKDMDWTPFSRLILHKTIVRIDFLAFSKRIFIYFITVFS